MAEEVLHDTYLQILEGRASFSGRSAFNTWLFAVIRNMASRQRYRLLQRINAVKGILGQKQQTQVQPDESLRRVELRQRFVELLSHIAPRQREVLPLVFYHEMTIEEAASVMGVSLGSARTHYHRGKERLRVEIEKAGFENE